LLSRAPWLDRASAMIFGRDSLRMTKKQNFTDEASLRFRMT
jgi:hypothetical protein